jgi:hypothetical protein
VRISALREYSALNLALSSVDPTPIGYSAVEPQRVVSAAQLAPGEDVPPPPLVYLHASGWATHLSK